MPEPPIQIDADAVAPAPRKTGRPSTDLVIACVAILLSLLSVGVAIENSLIQQRTLNAATWPFVLIDNSNGVVGPDGRPQIQFNLKNSGAGPAKIDEVRMFWRGHEVASNRALLQACCGAPAVGDRFGHGLQSNTVSPGVLVAGQSASFLVLPRSPEIESVWTALDGARADISFKVCYCSVFDQCWTTDGATLNPTRVKQCPIGKPFAN